MKQVFLSGQGGISVLEAPVPGRMKNSILVRNRYSLISTGTEGAAVTKNTGLLGLYEKAMASSDRIQQVWSMVKTQGLLQTLDTVKNKLADYTAIGYSTVGTVIEVDNENMPFCPGDTVACMGTGFANHAEYIVVPRNLVARVPDGVAIERAAFGALACIAMQGIRRLELTPGERVGVIGLGLIGQITMRLLAGMGFRPYGLDLSSARVALAQNTANAEAWSLDERDSVQYVLGLTRGAGLDGVIICAATDSDAPVNLAFDLCRKSGRVSLVGDVGLNLERSKMYSKELELRMSCSYGPGRYDADYEIRGQDYGLGHVRWSEGRNLEHFLWMLQAGLLDLDDLISECYPVEDAPAAYARIKRGDPAILAVLLDYGEPPDLPAAAIAAREGMRVEIGPAAPATIKQRGDGPVRLGIIGVGGYVKGMLLPQLKKLSNDFTVAALVTRTGGSAAAAARRFRVPVAASDHRLILDDPDIDAVLIATRHATHARFALEALAAGKHVFIEKPMAITTRDCLRIVEAQRQAQLVVRVGFNRRFSPFLQAMKAAVGQGCKLLNIRVNVGSIGNHWSNTAEEGGRLIGEGVHFIDLANWIMNCAPVGVSAQFVGDPDPLNPDACISIRYEDGSVANVVYTTMGHTARGKEYFELFGSGRTVVVDDYQLIRAYGCRIKTARADKGNKGQQGALAEFAQAIRHGEGNDGANAMAGLWATRIVRTAQVAAKSNNYFHDLEDMDILLD
jgi:predicted dehydrogenase/threonine dehydrogenase-like Zn-dependent dehydrogenase